jgi:hypothetical protein
MPSISPSTRTAPHKVNAAGALGIAVAVTLALYFVPFLQPLARPLLWLSTLAHELGHGVAAMLMGGHFDTLKFWSDGSGVASHSGNYSAFERAFVAAAGPLGPVVGAGAMFIAARHANWARGAMMVIAVLSIVILLVWVRTLFGIAFMLVFAGLSGLVAWRASPRIAQAICAFLAVQLSLATFSRADYLFMSQAHTGAGVMPSDTAQIAQALWLPYWLWGALIAVVSLAVLGLGLWSFTRALR